MLTGVRLTAINLLIKRLFQQGFDTAEQALRFGDGGKACDALAIGGEQEFGEVPLDTLAA
ncbi:hypothetical protein D3C78_1733690 [compost metagenome]